VFILFFIDRTLCIIVTGVYYLLLLRFICILLLLLFILILSLNYNENKSTSIINTDI